MSNSEADAVMSQTGTVQLNQMHKQLLLLSFFHFCAETNSMADTEEEDAESSTKEATAKIDELLSLETLRESPLQWPERCKYNQ